jgi:hypothetical protein
MIMKTLLITSIYLLSFSLFSQTYWQQEVNYTINVKLNDTDHTLSAFESFEYINHSPDQLDKLYIHLWPNAYKNGHTALAKQEYKEGKTILKFGDDSEKGWIDSLDFKINGSSVKYEYDPKNIDICILHLESPLRSGERLTVTTPFKVKIPSGEISRLGHIGQAYQITQWYPKPAVYDKNGWNPMPYLNQGEFYSEFGSFDVTIMLPKNYIVGATGDLQTQSEVDFLNTKAVETKERLSGLVSEANKQAKETPFPSSESEMKTIRYIQHNVHDFAWFADKRYAVLKGEVALPQSNRKVTTWAIFVPSNAKIWQHAIQYINDGTFYYSKWNGDYPYNQVTAVDGTISAGGGMEYPNVTVIGNASNEDDLEVVIVHEVGHNWFYGILGSNERVRGWMDEGMNTLNEIRYIQTKYPDNKRMSDMILGGRFHFNDLNHHDMADIFYRLSAALGEDQPIETHSAEFSSSNYGTIMYQKTGLVFYYLKDYLGEELFDQCMHAYFEEWKFKHPQPEDMRKTLERISGKNLDWLFDDLIQTTKHIDYKIKKVRLDDVGTEVKVKNVGQVDGPIEINFIRGEKIIQTQWVEPGDKRMSVHFAADLGKPSEIQIDASKDIPEINRSNNNWHVSGAFKKAEPLKLEFLIGDMESKRTNVFWTPLIGANYCDRFMFGVGLHNMGIPFQKFQYLLAPMYSTGRNMLSGIGEFSYTMLPKSGISLSRIGLSFKSFKYQNTETMRKAEGTYSAISPYWFTKLRNRKNSPFTQSVLVQGILRYNYNNGFTKDYWGGFAKYDASYALPDHKINLSARMDCLRAWDADVMRVSVEGTYRFRYMKKEVSRWIELRGFAGNYIRMSPMTSSSYRYGMSLNGTDGAQDLFFEDYFFGRGQMNGIWSQQRSDNMGGFKNSSFFGTTTDWMATTNLYAQLPIKKLGFLGFYADAGAFSNGVSVNSAFDAGLGIRLSNVFGVYFPVWMSKELADSFGNSSYGEKIKFILRINLVNKGLTLNSILQ